MDPLKNPFSPGAGSPPPELAGRESVIGQADVLLGRVKQGRSEKSMMLTGLRGVGKTVLLNTIRFRAEKVEYKTAIMEAHEGKKLAPLLVPYLRKLLTELSKGPKIGEKLKRGFATLLSFAKAIKIQINDFTVGIDVNAEAGSADSGDLEVDLPEVIGALGEAAKEQKANVALFIDEIQYLDAKELSALIMSMHKVQQRQLPVVLVGAGLPILPGLAGESKSYAERLFSFPVIGPLTEAETGRALQEPVRPEVAFNQDAVERIFRVTRGYPYFIQMWGYQSWLRAHSSPITLEVVEEATLEAIARLDNDFFRVRYDRCTNGEKKFLHSIAKLGAGSHKTSAVADMHGVKINSIGPVRAQLIKKGMIYSPEHGEIEFTVPLFGDFILRVMGP